MPVENDYLIPIENSWVQICTLVVLQVTLIIICVLLIFSIFSVSQKKTISTTNKLILSQTFADLLVALLFVPLCITSYLRPSNLVKLLLGHAICYILLLSLASLQALAWYRCRSVRNPIREFSHGDRGRELLSSTINKIIAAIWIVPLIFSLVPLIWVDASNDVKETSKQTFSFVLWGTVFLSFMHLVNLYLHHLKATQLFR